MITTCPLCRRGVANTEPIIRTAAGWVCSCCASGDGPARTGETITNHLYHYASVVDGNRRALLLGPYPDHDTALANVEHARRLATVTDGFAVFYAYGTASTNEPRRSRFGV